eukprot:1734747-Lingulodinium_polyedra.AAC.1
MEPPSPMLVSHWETPATFAKTSVLSRLRAVYFCPDAFGAPPPPGCRIYVVYLVPACVEDESSAGN